MITKKQGIPSISADRINNDPVCSSSPTKMADKIAHAFIKGREAKRALSVFVPIKLYDEFSKVTFGKKLKMTTVVNDLLQRYLEENKNT